jgi:hypothetical protein
MDHDTLDSFVRRIVAHLEPGVAGTLAVAVDMRRSQLDGETADGAYFPCPALPIMPVVAGSRY